MRVSCEELLELGIQVLKASRTSESNAHAVADALVAAECDGISSHGLARLPYYADQALYGKVNGLVKPMLDQSSSTSFTVDAAHGFAFPALALARHELMPAARNHGISACAVRRSHHAGVLVHAIEPLAREGLVALAFSNTPAAMAPAGGHAAALGTNPVAFAAPRASDAEPILVDVSLSQVARGKIVAAASKGDAIPSDWALDAHGYPTTQAEAALQGSMRPLGGPKGAALALMVELLAAALSGSRFAFEASSFFDTEGGPPGIGQLLIAIDPRFFGDGSFAEHATRLASQISAQPNTRIPGERRFELRAENQQEGIEIDEQLLEELNERR